MELMRNRDHMLDTWVEFGNKELQIGALHVNGSARSYVPLVSGRSLANKMGCRTSGDLH